MVPPIFKQGNLLLVSIPQGISDKDLQQLQKDLLERAVNAHSSGVIIDLTTVDVIDSFATRVLCNIAHAVKLEGAKTVVVGIQPEIAFAMVQLNLSFRGITTLLDLEDGLVFLNNRIKQRNTM